jgi:hypothetical protein
MRGNMKHQFEYHTTVRLEDPELFVGHGSCNVNDKITPNEDGKPAKVTLTTCKHGAWRHKDDVLSLIEGFNADFHAGHAISTRPDTPTQAEEAKATRQSARSEKLAAYDDLSLARGSGTPTPPFSSQPAGPSTFPAPFSAVSRDEVLITAAIPKRPTTIRQSLRVVQPTVNRTAEHDNDRADRAGTANSPNLPPGSKFTEDPAAPPFVQASSGHVTLQDDSVLEESATIQETPEKGEPGPVYKRKRKRTEDDDQKDLDEETAFREAFFERLPLDEILSMFSEDED